MRIDRVEDRSWLFRHVVAHDVAYDSLPFAMRARLHDRVGGFLESGGTQAIERNLDLLAYHYWLGEDDDKKRQYTVRAGISPSRVTPTTLRRTTSNAPCRSSRTRSAQPCCVGWARCSNFAAAGPTPRLRTAKQSSSHVAWAR